MEFLMMDWLGTPVWFWLAFIGIVITLTAFDLGILHKEDKEMGIAESLKLSAFYIMIAIAFGGYIWWAWSNGTLVTSDGTNPVASYFQGYIIEKVLSIDNVFVISLIFGYFAIPRKYQYRALVWGIIGVIVLRGIMILIGAALIAQFEWIIWVFGAFLLWTGVAMLRSGGHAGEGEPAAVKFAKRFIHVTEDYNEERFRVVDENAWWVVYKRI